MTERTVGSIGFDSIKGLAYDSSSDTLYGVDFYSGALLSFDTSTGNAMVIGSIARRISGLAYDSNTNILYGIRRPVFEDRIEESELVEIDVESGTSVTIGNTKQVLIECLAFDPVRSKLYGISSQQNINELFEIDTDTGLADSIGEIGLFNVIGLVFDPDNNVLYGSDTTKRQLIVINPKNGNVIDHGPKTGAALYGLAYR
jgi:uncharacterized protein YjiK